MFDDRDTVPGHTPTELPRREWVVTGRLRGEQMYDVVQTRGPTFDDATTARVRSVAARRAQSPSGRSQARRPPRPSPPTRHVSVPRPLTGW